jgi:hypothetical protein
METPTVKKRRKQPKKPPTNRRRGPNLTILVGAFNAIIGAARLVWMFFHHGSS